MPIKTKHKYNKFHTISISLYSEKNTNEKEDRRISAAYFLVNVESIFKFT